MIGTLRPTPGPLLALGLILAIALLGCGGGGGGEGTTAARTAPASAPPASTPTPTHTSPMTPSSAPSRGGAHGSRSAEPKGASSARGAGASLSGAAALETPGGDNSIQRFGSEAGASEIEAAGSVLHAYLSALAAADARGMCAELSKDARASLLRARVLHGSAKTCAEAIALFTRMPATAARQAAVADVAALRVEGPRGFLLYRGAQGAKMFIQLERKGGRWWVAAPIPSALP